MSEMNQEQNKNSSTSERVFQVAELLENILLNLELRTLLTGAQRVNKYWHGIITNSPELQRMLFLSPSPRKKGESREDQICNPLLVTTFPAWFANRDRNEASRDELTYGIDAFTNLPMSRSFTASEAFLRPRASWRRMLLAQPPIERLGCWMSENELGAIPTDIDLHFRILGFPQGLRMGTAYELAYHWTSWDRHSWFGMTWRPDVPRNLKSYNFLNSDKGEDEVLRICGAAVDMMMRFESCGIRLGHHAQQFSSCFDRRSKQDYADILIPEQDSGYQPLMDWSAKLASVEN
ncbi:hypothetical protein BS50DRAFT_679254 [Corynespora cassiicola Philippines]|uniref:F-box domain-containing protein n=1 Tax=Corynespora cassiicola Philippines TaxID=1448308 RepID=A0A2T2NF93_CORCC|nr:hypothetical protein BS50DRAFT_679254 [Corynespora cassiicola Philippines]